MIFYVIDDHPLMREAMVMLLRRLRPSPSDSAARSGRTAPTTEPPCPSWPETRCVGSPCGIAQNLLERERLGKAIFAAVNQHLQASGLKVATGTIVDATLIAAPSSTKNQDRERDPEMKQTKKGNQWYFGMKTHIGTDSRTRLIHSVAVTSANVHDSQVLPQLLHGRETRVWGDSAYAGQREAIRDAAPRAKDFTQHRRYRNRPLTELQVEQNRTKSSVRAKVEHAFGVIKRIFGFEKVRYRGLAKNGNRVQVLCALANVYLARRFLWQQQASCA